MFIHRHVRFCLHGFELFLAVVMAQGTCHAKLIPRRDPLDGALDATLIVIVKQYSQGMFRVEEVFLGDILKGQYLALPDFRLAVEDPLTVISGTERVEPIHENTRILVFLKPTETASRPPMKRQRAGNWAVAGFGNCYFWIHDPDKLESLRSMANDALALRRSWEAARDLPDEVQRAETLWPYLWNHNGSFYHQTEAALQELGPIAGDYIAGQLERMSYRQKDVFLNHFGTYRSPRLHSALIRELKKQETAWEELLRRRGGFATYEEVSPPGRNRSHPPQSQDAEADEADNIYRVLYQGFVGLDSFNDRNDLPFIRRAALWGVRYRFKQLGDAALEGFGRMPQKANLSVIQAIWDEFSQRPFVGNELQPFDVVRALESHRFPEAIPLMAQFVNIGFAQDLARQFLVEITGADFGDDTTLWLEWYRSHHVAAGEQ